MAFIVCICIVSVMILNGLFISLYAFHNCKGQDCPVCEQIYYAETAVNQISLGLIASTSIMVAPILLFFYKIFIETYLSFCNSLVLQKVRMNN